MPDNLSPTAGLSYGGPERTIAVTRLILAALALFGVWFDPDQPAQDTPLTFLYPGDVAYASLIVYIVWSRARLSWLPIASLAVDLAVLSVFQYLFSMAPNPIFMYFVFILFCAALRWGWVGALRTIPFGAALLVLGGSSVSRGLDLEEFELHHTIIRISYLAMIGALLVSMGRHEAGRRNEIQQLARWPSVEGTDASNSVRAFLEDGAMLMRAEGAVLAWSVNDEPGTVLARWTPPTFGMVTHSLGEVDPLVAESLGSDPFLTAGPITEDTAVMVQRGSAVKRWRGAPAHSTIAASLTGGSVASAAFASDRLSGRIFFAWSDRRTMDVLPLLEAVARQVGVSLDQMHGRDQQRRLAVVEERIRLARDLHDGVLQSLTGVRFELQHLWSALAGNGSSNTRERLLAMERALAGEQRELRRFIEDLKPSTAAAIAGSLRQRITDLCERLSTQWSVPVDVHIDDAVQRLPLELDHAVVPMVQEAVVNALKHGDPSRVRVNLQRAGDKLEVVVSDDGGGFEFEGEFDHDLLTARDLGPASLRDRVTSLGGRLAITSSATGARLRIGLPCEPVHN